MVLSPDEKTHETMGDTENIDIILIASSEITNASTKDALSLDRLELFRNLVFPNMVHHEGTFRTQIDLLNRLYHGLYYSEAGFEQRRNMMNVWNLPSFGGIYLAGFLEAYGLRCGVINNLESEWDRFCAMYGNGNTPLVGISTTFHLGWAPVQRVAKKLRTIDASMRLLVGGALMPTLAMGEPPETWEASLRRAGCEAALFAMNSEHDLLEYVRAGKDDSARAAVPNLAWFDTDGVYRINKTAWHEPLTDAFPVNWAGLDLPFVNRTFQMRTVVGCPFACRFCSYPVLSRGLRCIDMDQVEKMVNEICRIESLRQLIVLDDTANIPRDRFIHFCKLMRKNDLSWYCFLRPQFVDGYIAELMRDSGCEAVSLGVESGNDGILKNMNKMTTASEMANGIAHLHKAGIATAAFFIIGFPGETEGTVRETERFITGAGIDYYMLKDFFYIPSTGVDDIAAEYGLEGYQHVWKHATMDSVEASRLKESLYREMSSVTHLDSNTGMWQLAVMKDAGMTREEILTAQRLMNGIIKDQMTGAFSDSHPAFASLGETLSVARKRNG